MWTRPLAPAAPASRPSSPSQFHCSCLLESSIQCHSLTSLNRARVGGGLLGSRHYRLDCVWAWQFESAPLRFSPHCWRVCCCWPHSATHRGFCYAGSWRVRGGQRSATLFAVTDPGNLGVLRIEKLPWVQACWRSTYNHTESWGVRAVCVCQGVQKSCRWASGVTHLDPFVLQETVELWPVNAVVAPLRPGQWGRWILGKALVVWCIWGFPFLASAKPPWSESQRPSKSTAPWRPGCIPISRVVGFGPWGVWLACTLWQGAGLSGLDPPPAPLGTIGGAHQSPTLALVPPHFVFGGWRSHTP